MCTQLFVRKVLLLSLLYIINGQKIPYTFFDFDFINQTDIWENRNSVRAQIVNDSDITLLSSYPTSTTTDNNGVSIGVFRCHNQESGNIFNTPTSGAQFGELVFNEFSLEIIVKPTKNNVVFYGYMIGIEGTDDNIQGDSIGYNQINGQVSEQPNKFFPANCVSDGWKATAEYWDSTINTNTIDITKFHHVIVSQNNEGLVTVYVDGMQYGMSYLASGGRKNNTNVNAAFILKLCGDNSNNGNIGFDGYIRAFGFYTESFTRSDAFNGCNAVSHMVDCQTASPTLSTKIPSSSTNTPTKVPTKSPTHLATTAAGVTEEIKKELNWIGKDGINCGDGYTDLGESNVHYGKYCEPCPANTAGTYGVCEDCDIFQEPTHSRTECEYIQPWWLWLLEVVGGLTFVFGMYGLCKFVCKSKDQKEVRTKTQTEICLQY